LGDGPVVSVHRRRRRRRLDVLSFVRVLFRTVLALARRSGVLMTCTYVCVCVGLGGHVAAWLRSACVVAIIAHSDPDLATRSEEIYKC
jgi:hypothetical protein